MLRSIVLPLGLGFTGVAAVVAVAALQPALGPPRLTGRVPLVRIVRHVIATSMGGTAVLVAALAVYCAARGVDAQACISDAVRGIAPLSALASVGLVVLELAARAVPPSMRKPG